MLSILTLLVIMEISYVNSGCLATISSLMIPITVSINLRWTTGRYLDYNIVWFRFNACKFPGTNLLCRGVGVETDQAL